MNEDLVLFLEENGFSYIRPESEFQKKVLDRKMNEITLGIRSSKTIASKSITVISFYDSNDISFFDVRLVSQYNIKNKLNKIINSVDIISDYIIEKGPDYLLFLDWFGEIIYEKNIFSYSGYIIDLNSNELFISDNQHINFLSMK
jgi:hypothetical protein